MEMRELSDGELDAVNGGAGITLNFGFFKVYGSVTKDGVSGGVKVGDGKWHSGAIFYDDLPK